MPFFARKLRITFLVTYTHAVMTDKLNCWGHIRSVQTFPLPPTVRLDTLGDFQETLQIEVEAVKIASPHQLREGPQDFSSAGYEWLGPAWRSVGKEEGQHWCWQVLALSPSRWDLLPNRLGSGWGKRTREGLGIRIFLYLISNVSILIRLSNNCQKNYICQSRWETWILSFSLFLLWLKQKFISMLLTPMI